MRSAGAGCSHRNGNISGSDVFGEIYQPQPQHQSRLAEVPLNEFGSLPVTLRSEAPSPCPRNATIGNRSHVYRLIIALCSYPHLIKSYVPSQPLTAAARVSNPFSDGGACVNLQARASFGFRQQRGRRGSSVQATQQEGALLQIVEHPLLRQDALLSGVGITADALDLKERVICRALLSTRRAAPSPARGRACRSPRRSRHGSAPGERGGGGPALVAP